MAITVQLDKTTVKPGEEVKVTWTVTNGWTKGYNFKVTITHDGEKVYESTPFYLSPRQSKSGSIKVSSNKGGKHTVVGVSEFEPRSGVWMEDGADSKDYYVQSGEQKIAQVDSVSVIEYSSGKTHVVDRNGTVEVGEGRIKVRATVRNKDYYSRTIYAQLFVDGQAKERKSAYIGSGAQATFEWQVEIEEGSHTFEVKAGH